MGYPLRLHSERHIGILCACKHEQGTEKVVEKDLGERSERKNIGFTNVYFYSCVCMCALTVGRWGGGKGDRNIQSIKA